MNRQVTAVVFGGLSLYTVFLVARIHAEDASRLPAFASKISLLNFGGAVATEDGKAIDLYRLPAEVRRHINEKAQQQMLKPAHSEIRFVLNEGEKLANVKIHLEVLDEEGHIAPDGQDYVEFFGGDYQYFLYARRIMRESTLSFPTHGAFQARMNRLPRGRYPNHVCRMVFHGAPLRLLGVEGDIRPPKPEELPPVMITYGTSITQGARASRTDLAWPALTARGLGYDLVNLGSSGSAYCEPEIARYIAGQQWKLCILALSVNMVRDFSVEQFRERADYFVNTIAAARPDSTVICISLFPYFVDFDPGSQNVPKVEGFRSALEEICEQSKHANVRFVKGTDLLSPTGLSQDMIHPSDHGMIEISQNLMEKLKDLRVESE